MKAASLLGGKEGCADEGSSELSFEELIPQINKKGKYFAGRGNYMNKQTVFHHPKTSLKKVNIGPTTHGVCAP